MFPPSASRSGNLDPGSSLRWHAVRRLLSTSWGEGKDNRKYRYHSCEASFFRDAVQLNAKANWLRADRVASRYQYPSGSVNNGVSRGRIRTAGQPIAYARAVVRVFATMSINCIRIPYTHNTVKFVLALPQWRSASRLRSAKSKPEGGRTLDLIKPRVCCNGRRIPFFFFFLVRNDSFCSVRYPSLE